MSSQRITLGGGFYVPAVLAVITVIYLISALQLGPPMKGGNMTAAFFPIMTSIMMLIALACAMGQAVKQAQQQRAAASLETDRSAPDCSATKRLGGDDKRPSYLGISLGALGVVVLTAGYLIAFDRLGYLVATLGYVLLLIVLFSGGIKHNLVMKLVATVVITGAGYLLFEIVFQVRLPTLWSL
ncbi:tripartite tricarboxylate transporter TctB family protein [Terasakiispira papahanaumokuakeensis]|nr:tripartite tricarboxylate transporter TctB family protein [Terasakiispira papahanaumokuakeensis]